MKSWKPCTSFWRFYCGRQGEHLKVTFGLDDFCLDYTIQYGRYFLLSLLRFFPAGHLCFSQHTQRKDEINLVNSKCDGILRSNKKVNMKCKFSQLTKLHNSPFYWGVKLWHGLSVEIQCCRERNEFKTWIVGICK